PGELFRIEERYIAFEEIVCPQPVRRLPDHRLENAVFHFSIPCCYQQKNQQDRTLPRIGERIADHLGRQRRLNSQFLLEFPPQCIFRRFSPLDLATREFPFQRMRLIRTPPADQNPPVSHHNSCYHSCHNQLADDSQTVYTWIYRESPVDRPFSKSAQRRRTRCARGHGRGLESRLRRYPPVLSPDGSRPCGGGRL